MKFRWLTIFSCILVTACNGSSNEITHSNPGSPETIAPVDAESTNETQKNRTQSESQTENSTSPFAAIEARYQSAIQEFMKAYQAADEDDRKTLARDSYPKPDDFAAEFMALATDRPNSEVAFESLSWIVSQLQSGQLLDQAYEILLADHIDHADLTDACISLGHSDPSPQVESRLNLIIEKSSHDLVKAAATYSLASYLSRLENAQQQIADYPESAKFDEETLVYLDSRQIEPTEVESMFNTLVTDYPKLKPHKASKRNYKSMAERALFERQRLGVGMVAPEIEGIDLDGVTFRLSDYRGKVVILEFWGDWCGSCRERYPHVRSLIKQLADVPFVIIGVNSDSNLDSIRETVKTKDIPWRSFWNGKDGTGGSISTGWNISGWPTNYIIDAEGKIRFKNQFGRKMDEAIEELIGEVGHQVDLSERLHDEAEKSDGVLP